MIRRGTTVGTADPAATTTKQLAELMVGSELPSPETRESTVTDVPMLRVEDLALTVAESPTAPSATCSRASTSPSTRARSSASPASRGTARPS
ncbi:hypothetical protein SCALM49S_09124 [Streptomyces californicus]